jgi:hypothetical protein
MKQRRIEDCTFFNIEDGGLLPACVDSTPMEIFDTESEIEIDIYVLNYLYCNRTCLIYMYWISTLTIDWPHMLLIWRTFITTVIAQKIEVYPPSIFFASSTDNAWHYRGLHRNSLCPIGDHEPRRWTLHVRHHGGECCSTSSSDFCIPSIFSKTKLVYIMGTAGLDDVVAARPESNLNPLRILGRFTEANQHMSMWNFTD